MRTDQRTVGSFLFDLWIYASLTLFALATCLPFLHIIAASFTSIAEYTQKRFILFPTDWSLDAYRVIFSTSTLSRSLLNSVIVTLGGTTIAMLVSSMMAYGLSRPSLPGRRLIMFMVVFTLMFNGGIIPTFLVVKEIGLIDSYLAMMLPLAVNTFNLIILKSFFQSLPEGLEESAKIDGANDLVILFRIVIPLSLPAIATISLFYGVAFWNLFQQAVFYINDSTKWPIQVLLRQIVIVSSGLDANLGAQDEGFVRPPEQTIKMAVIVFATVPILLVYPFLQKYFAKGVLLGSVKG